MNTSKLKLHEFNAALWRQVPDSVCATNAAPLYEKNKTKQHSELLEDVLQQDISLQYLYVQIKNYLSTLGGNYVLKDNL